MSPQQAQLEEAIANKEILQSAYLSVFNSSNPDVAIVLEDMMKAGFVFKSTFVAGDSHATAMNEGSRRFMLSLVNRIYKDPTTQLKILKGHM